MTAGARPAVDAATARAHVLSLRTRGARDRTGAFFVEGVRFLVAAVESGAGIESLVVAPRMMKSAIGRILVRRLAARGVPALRVSPEAYAEITTSHEPQGVGLVVRQRWNPLSAVVADHAACLLAVEALRSPGNLGTLLRTSAATGASGLVALGRGVDPYDPGAVRATMGALFGQTITRAEPAELAAWAKRSGALVVGATADAITDYRAISYVRPVVLVLGAERKGLGADARRACDVVVRIPMTGRTDSLNVAVAGSVLLYEVWSQRHPMPRPPSGTSTCRTALANLRGRASLHVRRR